MNAAIPNQAAQFTAASAHVDEAAVQPLPNSRKIYVEGSQPDIRVPMREISQSDTPLMFGGEPGPDGIPARSEPNPPIFVYDCSGPYSDPAAKIDIRQGLPALRTPLDRGARRHRSAVRPEFGIRPPAGGQPRARRDALPRPAPHAAPRQGRQERQPDALRAQGHHHAGDGIHCHPREQQPHRLSRIAENVRPAGREARRHDEPAASGAELRRQYSRTRSRPNSCATKSRAAAPSSPTTSTTRNPSR